MTRRSCRLAARALHLRSASAPPRGNDHPAMGILSAVIVTFFCLVGVALSALTLPGVWVALAAAVACYVWRPELFSGWTLLICAGLAATGEVAEIAASAIGAKKAGGSRAGGWGALGGSLVGAVVGSFFVPPIGTIAGAVLGAGAGAMLGERHVTGKSWDDAARVGSGAAAGRLVATAAKIAICVAVAGTLMVAVWWP
ncbi:MAG: DUF456 family protein [Phycisphaerales bacterium]